ncbi:sensor histidine kinase [Tenacibaculum amylolyticum]|uniref:sensor histidine kinase n=1 Tax=Tenacibaculum amylolyticum TaxID=104269 RepID=UPI0038932108
MKKQLDLVFKNDHNPWLFNSFLWLFIFVSLLFVFSDIPIQKIDVIYTVTYALTLVFPVSFSLYFLIPRFLKKERNVLFLSSLFLVVIISAGVNILCFNTVIDFLFPDYYFISYFKGLKTVILFTVVIAISIFIKLAEDWVYFNKKERTALKLELSVLKNQINPHFLFNALNVLYSLSIKKKQETETTIAILQLSDILRYVIYEAGQQLIPIKKEVELITNYIAFEKNRNLPNVKIDFINSIKEDFKIAPMLLLPLVENAFKHGLKSGVEKPYIFIELHANNGRLYFLIENNFIPKRIVEKKYSGLGINNVKQYLEIVYPNNYEFNISNKESIYKVVLKINM